MKDSTELSKQQLKSKETKEKILRAAKDILQKKGYEHLSIKNICEEAGVSNGSFYHHFKTKDDLLSYYMEDHPSLQPELTRLPMNPQEVKTAIVTVYLNHVAYAKTLGVDFIAGYYTPRNQALNPDTRAERIYPIVTVTNYLEEAIAHGIIHPNLTIEEITTDIRMIVIGNAFEWSMRQGKVNYEENMRRSLTHYLDSVF